MMLITFLASFLIWIMFLGLLVLWIIDGKVKKEQVLHAIFAIIVAWIASSIFKELAHSTRPFVVNGFPPLTLTTPSDLAFPSIHAAIAFAMAFSIFLHNKKYGIYFMFAAILVGLGRVLANVHYTLDIIGGAVIGLISVYLTQRLHLRNIINKK